MLEKIFLLLIVVLALMSLNTKIMRRAIIYMGLFSLTSSFLFLLYSAPDVALAEAVIASSLLTVLFLVALNRIKTFTIYYSNDEYNEISDELIIRSRVELLKDIEHFYVHKEIEPQIIYTTEDYNYLLEKKEYDLVIYQKQDAVYIYGLEKDSHLDDIEQHLQGKEYENLSVSIIRLREDEYNGT